MAFKVHVGPPQITVHQGQTVLVSELDGQINWPSEKGLYFLDTRMISSWAIYANGEQFELLTGGPISYYATRIFLTNKLIRTEDGVQLWSQTYDRNVKDIFQVQDDIAAAVVSSLKLKLLQGSDPHRSDNTEAAARAR